MIEATRVIVDAAVLDLTLIALVSVVFIACQTCDGRGPDAGSRRIALLWSSVVACGALTSIAVGEVSGALAVTVAVLAAASLTSWLLPRLSSAGALSLAVQPLLLVAGVAWGLLLLSGLSYPAWAMAIVVMGGAVAFVTVAFTLAGSLVRQATLTHVTWRRPNRPLLPVRSGACPMISVQVPCYAEPPELVIETLDRIAAQSYPRFEVMVCDNNTADESLWRPVEAHCRRLNQRLGFDRFRFFHVAPLDGAKAGALNWCLDRMAPDAALVAVMDADYQADPDFLARLSGFFDDPAIGYVQTPHDYRACGTSTYLRACYWEYMPTNKVVYPGINEYNAAFTIGTMCVIRADAIRAVGGWAEWCLTEDSEISVRLRAIGLDGIYLPQTFGRGLIPETFEDYRKQRFRWVAGPVQQLRRYWRHYLPGRLATPSGLNGWSKLLEFQRSAAPVIELAALGLSAVTMVAMLALSGSGLLPDLVLPDMIWPLLAIGAATGLIARWTRYRMSGCTRIGDMALAEMAKSSLALVQMSAAIAGLSSRAQPWRRTPKFAVAGSWRRAMTATVPETIAGGVSLILALVFLVAAEAIGAHLTLLGSAGFLLAAARFFTAPAMALLCERDLARREREQRAIDDRFALIRQRQVLTAA